MLTEVRAWLEYSRAAERMEDAIAAAEEYESEHGRDAIWAAMYDVAAEFAKDEAESFEIWRSV